jgi:uncharacterized protein YceH (UPF0502 family)
MTVFLSEIEARVLGSLIEKDLATPDYYPLSLNALKNACNQKNNRDPLMSLDQQSVEAALENLRGQKLSLIITGGDNRVPKYAHRASETLNLDNRDLAILAVLLLRGPQTIGELRSRAQGMHGFDDLAAVENCLRRLMEREPEPLVKRLERQSGLKEPRYGHLLSGDVAPPASEPAAPERQPLRSDRDRIAALEATVEALQAEVSDLTRELAEFRKQFE